MTMQIKILHNNFCMFYKMALKIYFHKYFQCTLVDDKNTKLSFIIYAIDVKTCFCTVEIDNNIAWRAELRKHLKSKYHNPMLAALIDRASHRHWCCQHCWEEQFNTERLGHNANAFLKIKCFINMRKYLKEK